MIKIKPLKSITIDEMNTFGYNGFMTDIIYQVERGLEVDGISFTITPKKLDSTYVKEWRTTVESISYYNDIISKGLSLGAYDGERLVGFIVASDIDWNNSLWIENIRVADNYKGQGISQMILEAMESLGKEKDYRLIGLEVMASNYPAIQAYKRQHYIIDGVDMSLYPTRPGGQKEVALFMKKYLSDRV